MHHNVFSFLANSFMVMEMGMLVEFLFFFAQHVGGIKSTRWKCWWVALTWTIWQQRNRIVFQNDTFNGSKVLDDAVLLIWTWLKSMEKDFALDFNQWSTNLRAGFCI